MLERHCRQCEAIQGVCVSTLDCFVTAFLAMTGGAPHPVHATQIDRAQFRIDMKRVGLLARGFGVKPTRRGEIRLRLVKNSTGV